MTNPSHVTRPLRTIVTTKTKGCVLRLARMQVDALMAMLEQPHFTHSHTHTLTHSHTHTLTHSHTHTLTHSHTHTLTHSHTRALDAGGCADGNAGAAVSRGAGNPERLPGGHEGGTR